MITYHQGTAKFDGNCSQLTVGYAMSKGGKADQVFALTCLSQESFYSLHEGKSEDEKYFCRDICYCTKNPTNTSALKR